MDFLGLLQKPAPVRFLVATPKRWAILKAALAGALLFLWRTLYRLFGGAGGAAVGDGAPQPAGAGEGSANEPQTGSRDGGN